MWGGLDENAHNMQVASPMGRDGAALKRRKDDRDDDARDRVAIDERDFKRLRINSSPRFGTTQQQYQHHPPFASSHEPTGVPAPPPHPGLARSWAAASMVPLPAHMPLQQQQQQLAQQAQQLAPQAQTQQLHLPLPQQYHHPQPNHPRLPQQPLPPSAPSVPHTQTHVHAAAAAAAAAAVQTEPPVATPSHYGSMNALLSQLHNERVRAGARQEWKDEDDEEDEEDL